MHALQEASYPVSGCRVEPPVKNTFIHFNLNTSENDASAETEADSSVLRASYRKSHSDPVHGDCFTSEHSTTTDRSTSTQSSLRSLPHSGWVQSSSHMTEVSSSSCAGSGNSFFIDAEALKSEDRNSGSHAPLHQGSEATRQNAVELPEGIPSVGALGHNKNACKPCAWSWKPGGCVFGKSCEFCHMCDKGELKRRSKERVTVLRKTEQGAMVTALPADVVATATSVHYPVEVIATHLPAKRNTRISP